MDLAADGTFYCLQPTRVICVNILTVMKNFCLPCLIMNLLRKASLRTSSEAIAFTCNRSTPIEHQADLERVLKAYKLCAINCRKTLLTGYSLFFLWVMKIIPALKLNLEPLCIEAIISSLILCCFRAKRKDADYRLLNQVLVEFRLSAAVITPKKFLTRC